MQNPNQAVERIKNHLAYKLGQAMINYKCNGGGYCHLIKKLYQITKQHKKEKIIYKSTIQVFPSLQYPKLEFCPDYNEALKCKFHLSYLLGEALIKAHKNWYKGGYLFLFKDIKKAKKEFKFFKEFFEELGLNSSTIFNNLTNNKKTFLKECQKIQNILKTHQDYKAIIDNIFHNFNYFIQNFTLIEEWLLSNDFYEKYKKENHPYPSLMDPKKLNDENEVINYKNIPAELAWEMNLPLPDNYEFIWLGSALSGHAAMTLYLEYCNINICRHTHWEPKIMYSNISTQLLNNTKKYNIIAYIDYTHIYISRQNLTKFLNLLDKNKPVLFLSRDPISRLKTGLNHINSKIDKLDYCDLKTSIDKVLDRTTYYFESPVPTCEHLKSYWIHAESFLRWNFLAQLFDNITYLDMEQIRPKYIYNSLKSLSELYHFNIISKELLNFGTTYDELATLLPITLYANPIDIDKSSVNETFEILITTKQLLNLHKIKNYKEINSLLFKNGITFDNLIFCILEEKFSFFKDNIKLVKYVQSYLQECITKLEIKIKLKKEQLISEHQILEYFSKNKTLALEFNEIFKKELTHIKQVRPDIVASWKYYQEFEKMCEELDVRKNKTHTRKRL